MSLEQLSLFVDQVPAEAHAPLVRQPETREELDAIVNAIPEREIIASNWERVANGYIGPFCILNDRIEIMFWTDPDLRPNGPPRDGDTHQPVFGRSPS